jgi:hypothetical protein
VTAVYCPRGSRSVSRWMEIGVFPAYPRGIAASEIPGASLKRASLRLRVWIEAFVPLVIRAAKMLIHILTLDIVLRRRSMDPQMLMSCVSRENRRRKCDGKNGYHAHRSCHGHLVLLAQSRRGSTTIFIDAYSSILRHFLFSGRAGAAIARRTTPRRLCFGRVNHYRWHSPICRSQKAAERHLVQVFASCPNSHMELSSLMELACSTRWVFLSL